ncbi:glycosyltransferase family 2 protein [Candidatus Shapirobacteria bacterium]|nr:glycosyltransferase family 2 protein [Candidatus Shapirobacteria bacterium]
MTNKPKALKLQSSKVPYFSIVIPNYNGAAFIEPCLLALKKAISQCPSSLFEIILVDNGSTDTSTDIFIKVLSSLKIENSCLPAGRVNLKIIRLQTNHGFATAVNKGIVASKYDYVCVLNNDLNLEPNWFDHISKAITNNPNFSTFCGTVLSYDGSKIESQGLRYFMSGRCENINNGKPFSTKVLKLKSSKVPVWGSSAAVVVYQKSAITKVGLFDESFFAYIEDVDLAYRLQKSGFKSLLIPKAISYHMGGRTSDSMGTLRQYYTLRNWIKLITKNYSKRELVTNLPSISIERLRNLSYLIRSSLIIKQ